MPSKYLKLFKSLTTACTKVPSCHTVLKHVVKDVAMRQTRNRLLPVKQRKMTSIYPSVFTLRTKPKGTDIFPRTLQLVPIRSRKLYPRCMRINRQEEDRRSRQESRDKPPMLPPSFLMRTRKSLVVSSRPFKRRGRPQSLPPYLKVMIRSLLIVASLVAPISRFFSPS